MIHRFQDHVNQESGRKEGYGRQLSEDDEKQKWKRASKSEEYLGKWTSMFIRVTKATIVERLWKSRRKVMDGCIGKKCNTKKFLSTFTYYYTTGTLGIDSFDRCLDRFFLVLILLLLLVKLQIISWTSRIIISHVSLYLWNKHGEWCFNEKGGGGYEAKETICTPL